MIDKIDKIDMIGVDMKLCRDDRIIAEQAICRLANKYPVQQEEYRISLHTVEGAVNINISGQVELLGDYAPALLLLRKEAGWDVLDDPFL